MLWGQGGFSAAWAGGLTTVGKISPETRVTFQHKNDLKQTVAFRQGSDCPLAQSRLVGRPKNGTSLL